MSANKWRGEVAIEAGGEKLLLRPSFAALTAAEAELGSLFALVERAAEGRLLLGEVIALFWHCLCPKWPGEDRAAFAELIAGAGLMQMTPALKQLIGQILQGR